MQKNGIKVVSLNMKKNFMIIFKMFRLFLILKKLKPDIIQTWMYHSDFLGGIIGRLAGVKNIFWNVTSTNYVTNKSSSKLSTRIIAKLCSYLSKFIPKKIITCSHEAIRVHTLIGYDKTKFVLIPNGFDTEFLSLI